MPPPGIVPTSSEVTIASFMQVLGTGSCGTVWLVADEADTPHSVLRPIRQSDEAAGQGEHGGGRVIADAATMDLYAHAAALPSPLLGRNSRLMGKRACGAVESDGTLPLCKRSGGSAPQMRRGARGIVRASF